MYNLVLGDIFRHNLDQFHTYNLNIKKFTIKVWNEIHYPIPQTAVDGQSVTGCIFKVCLLICSAKICIIVCCNVHIWYALWYISTGIVPFHNILITEYCYTLSTGKYRFVTIILRISCWKTNQKSKHKHWIVFYVLSTIFQPYNSGSALIT